MVGDVVADDVAITSFVTSVGTLTISANDMVVIVTDEITAEEYR